MTNYTVLMDALWVEIQKELKKDKKMAPIIADELLALAWEVHDTTVIDNARSLMEGG